MPSYRLALDAGVCFTVSAKDEEEAFKHARGLIRLWEDEDGNPGMLGLPVDASVFGLPEEELEMFVYLRAEEFGGKLRVVEVDGQPTDNRNRWDRV